jgi:hypothetical protein
MSMLTRLNTPTKGTPEEGVDHPGPVPGLCIVVCDGCLDLAHLEVEGSQGAGSPGAGIAAAGKQAGTQMCCGQHKAAGWFRLSMVARHSRTHLMYRW